MIDLVSIDDDVEATRIEAVIPGLPVAKARARGDSGVHRTPGKTRQWEAVAAEVLRKAAAGHRYPGRVQLTVIAVFPRPLSLPEIVPVIEWDHGGRVFASSRADLDNVIKAVQDAANKAGIWADDRRVVRLDGCESVYAAVGESPCVEVYVTDTLPRPRSALRIVAARPELRDVGELL